MQLARGRPPALPPVRRHQRAGPHHQRLAECLHRAYEDNKARDTIQEMLKADDLAQYPEFEEGKQLLSKLESR